MDTQPANLPIPQPYIGTAGWSIPKDYTQVFPSKGTHLERYARVLRAVEINTSFYRPHRPTTYARWAESVPAGFRFAVKVPKEITHTRRLVDPGAPLDSFLPEAAALGEKLGPLLVQLPPSLRFNLRTAETFFAALRKRFAGQVVCEPRHATWFTPEAGQLLEAHQVARLAADPAIVPAAASPGGWGGLVYYRLHGSPQMYISAYPPDFIEALAQRLKAEILGGAEAWCIFDNTAEGAALGNALELLRHFAPPSEPA